jgi:hypothetical protein
MDSLPLEILDHLTNFLKIPDFVALVSTSHYFRSLSRIKKIDHEYNYSQICKSPFYFSKIRYDLPVCSDLTGLNLEDLTVPQNYHAGPIRMPDTLTRIVFHHYSIWQFPSTLRCLELYYPEVKGWIGDHLDLSAFERLEELIITEYHGQHRLPPKITRLTIYNASLISCGTYDICGTWPPTSSRPFPESLRELYCGKLTLDKELSLDKLEKWHIGYYYGNAIFQNPLKSLRTFHYNGRPNYLCPQFLKNLENFSYYCIEHDASILTLIGALNPLRLTSLSINYRTDNLSIFQPFTGLTSLGCRSSHPFNVSFFPKLVHLKIDLPMNSPKLLNIGRLESLNLVYEHHINDPDDLYITSDRLYKFSLEVRNTPLEYIYLDTPRLTKLVLQGVQNYIFLSSMTMLQTLKVDHWHYDNLDISFFTSLERLEVYYPITARILPPRLTSLKAHLDGQPLPSRLKELELYDGPCYPMLPAGLTRIKVHKIRLYHYFNSLALGRIIDLEKV